MILEIEAIQEMKSEWIDYSTDTSNNSIAMKRIRKTVNDANEPREKFLNIKDF